MQQFENTSLQDSIRFAHDIAAKLGAGSIICFKGDLGTGKTFIIKHIIQKLLTSDINVTSPTFNIVQTYPYNNYKIYHYDLYRIKSRDEIFELNIEDAFNGQNICLIEWPEIILDMVPKNSIILEIKQSGPESRIITLYNL